MASQGTSAGTVSTMNKSLLAGLSKLGGARPRSAADFTCPSDDLPELLIVTRDYLYGMVEAQTRAATCAFHRIQMDAAEELPQRVREPSQVNQIARSA